MKSILCAMLFSLVVACGGEKKPCPVPVDNPNVVNPKPTPDAELGIDTFLVTVVPDGEKHFALYVTDQALQYDAEIFRIAELVEDPNYADVLALPLSDGTLVDVLQADGRLDEDFYSANLCQGEFHFACTATVITNGKKMKWLRIAVPLPGGGHTVFLCGPKKTEVHK